MKTDELKSIQAPLKQKYKDNPESALITLKARGKIDQGITCKVDTGKTIVQAGLHPATGGDGLSLCSGDMLLEALVACAGVTLKAVATAMGIELEDAIVRAEGDIDFRGTLAVSKEAPVGFKNIRLFFEINSQTEAKNIESLIKLTERYCVVYQSLSYPAKISVKYELHN